MPMIRLSAIIVVRASGVAPVILFILLTVSRTVNVGICTVLDYLDAVTLPAAMCDHTLDHDGAPPGQFFDTEYHLERHQSNM